MKKTELEDRLSDMQADLKSPFIPTIAMKLGLLRGKLCNGLGLAMMPMEDPQDKVGLGVYPLLECVGTASPVLPEHEDVARQLCKLLRCNQPCNNVNPARLKGIFESGALPATTTTQVVFEWPEYVEVGGQASSRNVTGMTMFLSFLHVS